VDNPASTVATTVSTMGVAVNAACRQFFMVGADGSDAADSEAAGASMNTFPFSFDGVCDRLIKGEENVMFKSKPSLRFWLALTVLCLLLGFSFDFGSSDSKPGVTKSNCDRIEVGMTEKEVETLLGGPATRVIDEFPDIPSTTKEWIGGNGSVVLVFSEGEVLWRPLYFKKLTLLDRTLKWLGLHSKKQDSN
jgi:hypothetical protein